MFTRYSNIEIPQNYSGNRFKKNPIEDTTMKIHESEIKNEIKTSVSPTYNDWIYTKNSPSFSQITNTSPKENINLDIQNDNIHLEKTPNETTNKDNSQLFNTDFNDDSLAENKVASKKYDFTQILNHLKRIKNDDLLLVILIIFLASDKNIANNEVIILLALLLTM